MNRRGFFRGLAAVATALGVPELGAAENRWGVFTPTGSTDYFFEGPISIGKKAAPLGTFSGHTMFLDRGVTIIFPDRKIDHPKITLVEVPNE